MHPTALIAIHYYMKWLNNKHQILRVPEVLCNTDTRAFSDICTFTLRHHAHTCIRQSTLACIKTYTYNFIYQLSQNTMYACTLI